MARVRIALPPPDAIRALADDEGRIAVRVTPGARSEAVEIVDGGLVVKVRAKPQDGAANAAVAALLANALGIAPSRLDLVRGATAREKVFRILD
jgi:uncharacterized protein YggU (UPF0235/DUF167 family)